MPIPDGSLKLALHVRSAEAAERNIFALFSPQRLASTLAVADVTLTKFVAFKRIRTHKASRYV